MHAYKLLLSIVLTALLLTGCAKLQPPVDTTNLNDLKGLKSRKVSGKAPTGIRSSALKDIATGIGAQAGLSWRSQNLNFTVKLHDKRLDQVFDFSALLLLNNVLPPILMEGRDSYNQANNASIRIADRTYVIVRNARFVSTPPNWRDYLMQDFKKPEVPQLGLLPKNTTERKIWEKAMQVGWNAGIRQADIIFDDALAKLSADFKGIVLYRKLLAQNMVSKPYVAKTDLGVTGDANKMYVNDQFLRITSMSALNTDASKWKPVLAR